MNRWVLWGLLVAAWMPGLGAGNDALENRRLDSLIRSEQRLFSGDLSRKRTRGEQWMHTGLQENSCEAVLVGHALLLDAHIDDPEHGERPRLDEASCLAHGMVLPKIEGTWEFMYGDLTEARRWYLKSLEAAEGDKDRASLMQAIGTCYYMQNHLDSALIWYEASTKMGLHNLSATSLMNLASIQTTLGKANESLIWSQKAEARLIQELNEGLDPEVFVLRRDMILINQGLAWVELGEMKEALDVAQKLKLKDFLPGIALESYHFLFCVAWFTDDPQWILRHQTAFSEHLIRDSAAAVGRFGPTLGLIDPWRSACEAELGEGGIGIWDRLKALPKEELPGLLEPGRMKSQSEWVARRRMWGYVGSGVFFVLGLAAFLKMYGLGRGNRGWKAEKRLERIREEVVTGETSMGLQSLVGLVREDGIVSFAAPGGALTPREIEVLFGQQMGERAKETALRMGVGVKTIYMIRTDLRRKLGLKETESLESWLNNWASK